MIADLDYVSAILILTVLLDVDNLEFQMSARFRDRV